MNEERRLVDRLPRRGPSGGLGRDRHTNSEKPGTVPSQLARGRGYR